MQQRTPCAAVQQPERSFTTFAPCSGPAAAGRGHQPQPRNHDTNLTSLYQILVCALPSPSNFANLLVQNRTRCGRFHWPDPEGSPLNLSLCCTAWHIASPDRSFPSAPYKFATQHGEFVWLSGRNPEQGTKSDTSGPFPVSIVYWIPLRSRNTHSTCLIPSRFLLNDWDNLRLSSGNLERAARNLISVSRHAARHIRYSLWPLTTAPPTKQQCTRRLPVILSD